MKRVIEDRQGAKEYNIRSKQDLSDADVCELVTRKSLHRKTGEVKRYGKVFELIEIDVQEGWQYSR